MFPSSPAFEVTWMVEKEEARSRALKHLPIIVSVKLIGGRKGRSPK